MNHYLMTQYNFDIRRFIRRDNIRPWMNYRFDIFKRFVAPSVNGQVNKPRKWFMIFDPITLNRDIDKVQECSDLIEPIRTEEPYKYLRKRLLILENKKLFSIAVIDSDDVIEKNYFSIINSRSSYCTETHIIDLNFWIRIDLDFIKYQYIYNTIRRKYQLAERSKSPVIVQKAENYIFLPNVDGFHIQLGRKIEKLITMDAALLQLNHKKNLITEFVDRESSPLMSNSPVMETDQAFRDWLYDTFSIERV